MTCIIHLKMCTKLTMLQFLFLCPSSALASLLSLQYPFTSYILIVNFSTRVFQILLLCKLAQGSKPSYLFSSTNRIPAHTGLFSLRVIFAVLHQQTVLPHLEFAQRQFQTSEFHPVFNQPADNEGKRGKSKMGVNISMYTVYVTEEICILIRDCISV